MNKLLMPFLPLIMEFLTGRKDHGGLTAQVQLLSLVSSEVKKQLSSLILKIAAGLVATGVLIYSLIVLGQYFHAYLLTFENGPVFSSIFFAIVSVACIAGLFQLFRPEKPLPAVQDLQDSVHNFSFEKIYANFLQGLTEGAEIAREDRVLREQRRRQETSREVAEQIRAETAAAVAEGPVVNPGGPETDTLKPREAVADARTAAEKHFGYYPH